MKTKNKERKRKRTNSMFKTLKNKTQSVYKRQMHQKLILKGIMVDDFNLEKIRAGTKKKKERKREMQIISNSKVSDSAGTE